MNPGIHAKTQPEKPAHIMAASGQVVTYAELDERSLRLAQLLYARGLRPGDHVAIYMENAGARYQARSAHALGRFGGPQAERALRKALAGDLRLDAEQEVRSALDGIAGR